MHNCNNFNNGLPGFPNNNGYDLIGRYQVGYPDLMDPYKIHVGRPGIPGINNEVLKPNFFSIS